ncbi:MAG: sensor histidine kinase [Planctomycetota bacterium]
MYKRIIILSLIIILALAGLAGLGYHSMLIRAQGMEAKRIAEFGSVAENIRHDIMQKLDKFIAEEQNRPYTDYQYYSLAQNVSPAEQTQTTVQRSPLAGKLESEFALSHFQVDLLGNITTANDDILEMEGINEFNKNIDIQNSINKDNIKNNLLPTLNGTIPGTFKLPAKKETLPEKQIAMDMEFVPKEKQAVKRRLLQEQETQAKGSKSSLQERRSSYRVPSLEKQAEQIPQITNVSRSAAYDNIAWRQQQQAEAGQIDEQKDRYTTNTERNTRQRQSRYLTSAPQPAETESPTTSFQQNVREQEDQSQALRDEDIFGSYSNRTVAEETEQVATFPDDIERNDSLTLPEEMIQIRIEPFVPIVVPGRDNNRSLFNGQVFLLRHVQIESDHLLQGFKLNEKKLTDEIKDSASKLIRRGMKFEISKSEDVESAYTAILDFGFGELVLNLFETDPAWIAKEIKTSKNWYFGIVAVVFAAVILALASLWRNAHEQLRLAQKKDDFISAVSHELRTPLTSIRMYAEMLEKDWVTSKEKVNDYYKGLRQESERLTRLIENVLDFSRIQRGKKQFAFTAGNINACLKSVIEMMSPYAAQHGFSITTDLAEIDQTAFDSDAVTQIVVNLLDNAVKYAGQTDDKTITVRTAIQGKFITIEVEDHGPGIPHRHRKKIFEQFYRCQAESTRETNGTGLGLALVKKFAEAHNGFVEILNAKPKGSIFKVTLAMQN